MAASIPAVACKSGAVKFVKLQTNDPDRRLARPLFCLVADTLETDNFERRSSVGSNKIVKISDDLVLGFAGPSTALPEIEREVRRSLPSLGSWDVLEEATLNIVGDVNDRTYSLKQSLKEMVTVVIAGSIGGRPGLFDMGPFAVSREPGQTALSQVFAFACSGGICASAARALASKCCSEVTGEDLLVTIVEAGVRMDPGQTGNRIWRADLHGACIPYEWLCVLPEASATPQT